MNLVKDIVLTNLQLADGCRIFLRKPWAHFMFSSFFFFSEHLLTRTSLLASESGSSIYEKQGEKKT